VSELNAEDEPHLAEDPLLVTCRQCLRNKDLRLELRVVGIVNAAMTEAELEHAFRLARARVAPIVEREREADGGLDPNMIIVGRTK